MKIDRRGTLAAGALALTGAAEAGAAPAGRDIVLVHGAWHGGWCWRDVAADLRTRGHRVFTPTLTGLGERLHLGTATTDVAAHAEDVRAAIACEELANVVLVGHSYAGLVISYVDHPAVTHLVYLDALLPEPGRAMFAALPEPQRAAIEATLVDGFRLPPFPVAMFDVPTSDAAATAWLARRLTSMPVGPFSRPQPMLPARWATTARTYVACTGNTLDGPKAGAARARAEGWDVRPLAAGHDAMVTAPAATAALLDGLARG